MKRSILSIVTAICVLLCTAVQAQTAENIFCRDFQRSDIKGQPQHLYQYLSDNKMVFLVAGDIRQEATRELLQSYSLQRLAEDHGNADHTSAYSTNDVQVIFLQYNAELPGAGAVQAELADLPFPAITVQADDNLLPEELANTLSPAAPGIFLVSPDHLVRPVQFSNAREAYRVAGSYKTSYRPGDEPDVRIIRCLTPAVAGDHISANVFFQNYSNLDLGEATIQLFAGNTPVAQARWHGKLAPLETGNIVLNATLTTDAPLKVYITTGGERYLLNNSLQLDDIKHYSVTNATALPCTIQIDKQLPDGNPGGANSIFSAVNKGTISNEALRVSFSNMLPMQKDTLFIGNYNLTRHPVLSFSRAYAPSSELSDAAISFIVSTDEGQTWTVVKSYTSNTLMTTNTQSYAYHPQNGHEWIRDHISLSEAGDRKNVWIAIVATADYTNDAYINNIHLDDATPVMASK